MTKISTKNLRELDIGVMDMSGDNYESNMRGKHSGVQKTCET